MIYLYDISMISRWRARRENEKPLEFVWCSDGYFLIHGILSIMASFVILSSISDTTISNQYISPYTHVYIRIYIHLHCRDIWITVFWIDCSIYSHTPTSRRSRIPGAPRSRRCGVWLPLLVDAKHERFREVDGKQDLPREVTGKTDVKRRAQRMDGFTLWEDMKVKIMFQCGWIKLNMLNLA